MISNILLLTRGESVKLSPGLDDLLLGPPSSARVPIALFPLTDALLRPNPPTPLCFDYSANPNPQTPRSNLTYTLKIQLISRDPRFFGNPQLRGRGCLLRWMNVLLQDYERDVQLWGRGQEP